VTAPRTAPPASVRRHGPSLVAALARGFTGRCGRCGAGGILRGFSLTERCPRCGLRFDREEGFRSGALGINTIVTFALLAIVVGTGIAVTMPDVAVVPVFAAAAAVALVVPIVFFPLSLTTWAAVDVWMRPPGAADDHDRYDERARRVSSSRLAELIGPSLDEIVVAHRDAQGGDLTAIRRAFDGRGPAAVALRAGTTPVRFDTDAHVVGHELLAEGVDGWRVRFTVDGATIAGAEPVAGVGSFDAVLRWSPADERWFSWSLDPAVRPEPDPAEQAR
jgi:uncharacterized protein (DUF983 family)